MTTKVKNNQKPLTYAQGISRTNEDLQFEQKELTIQQAELNFSQSLLSLKGQLLTAEGEMKKKESYVNNAELALANSKFTTPENLVQNIVNAKQALKQAELNLETAREAHSELNSMYEFLEDTKKELFS